MREPRYSLLADIQYDIELARQGEVCPVLQNTSRQALVLNGAIGRCSIIMNDKSVSFYRRYKTL